MNKFKINNKMETVSDQELLVMFPEAAPMIRQKVLELEAQKATVLAKIRQSIYSAHGATYNEFDFWFICEVLKITLGDELLEIQGHINRLKRQLWFSNPQNKNRSSLYTEEQIQQALSVPLEKALGIELRKAGRTFKGLCPFHQEKTGSFHIWPENNTAWCFGCNQGGDAIKIIQLIRNCGFREAVEYLLDL